MTLSKTALLVTAYWPPTLNSGTLRWAGFAPLLAQRGWQLRVITPARSAEEGERRELDFSLEHRVEDVETWRLQAPDPVGWYAALIGRSGLRGRRPDLTLGVGPLERLARLVRKEAVVPDPRAVWAAWVLPEVLRRLKRRPPDLVLSSGPPHSMHLVANGVARRCGVPWIADHRDPWFFEPALEPVGPARWAHARLQKSMDGADAEIVVTQAHRKTLKSERGREATLIRNGFDEAQLIAETPRSRAWVVAHVGLLHQGRHASAVWRGLASAADQRPELLADLDLRLVGIVADGVPEELTRLGLSSACRRLGPIEHPEAVREMQSADVLLLLGAQAASLRDQMPAKLYEYLATQSHILGSLAEDAEAAEWVLKVGGEVLSPTDEGAWLRAFLRAHDRYRVGQRRVEREPWVQSLAREQGAAQLVRLFDSVMEGAAAA